MRAVPLGAPRPMNARPSDGVWRNEPLLANLTLVMDGWMLRPFYGRQVLEALKPRVRCMAIACNPVPRAKAAADCEFMSNLFMMVVVQAVIGKHIQATAIPPPGVVPRRLSQDIIHRRPDY